MVLSGYHFSDIEGCRHHPQSLGREHGYFDKPRNASKTQPGVYSRNPTPAHYIGSGAVAQQLHDRWLPDLWNRGTLGAVSQRCGRGGAVVMIRCRCRCHRAQKRGGELAIISMDTVWRERQNRRNRTRRIHINQKLCSDEISVIDRGLMIKGAVIPGNTMVEYREDLMMRALSNPPLCVVPLIEFRGKMLKNAIGLIIADDRRITIGDLSRIALGAIPLVVAIGSSISSFPTMYYRIYTIGVPLL